MGSDLECKSCGQKFQSAESFNEHFERKPENSTTIVGCKKVKK
jgi:hypothetical protein